MADSEDWVFPPWKLIYGAEVVLGACKGKHRIPIQPLLRFVGFDLIGTRGHIKTGKGDTLSTPQPDHSPVSASPWVHVHALVTTLMLSVEWVGNLRTCA